MLPSGGGAPGEGEGGGYLDGSLRSCCHSHGASLGMWGCLLYCSPLEEQYRWEAVLTAPGWLTPAAVKVR